MILPDLLEAKLSLVICGTAPSRVSKQQAAYYAHPGNIFWKTLHEAGLTPGQLAANAYADLLKYRIGLTDLNKTEWGADSELSRNRFDAPAFIEKMRRFQPKAIAFSSKFAASKFFGRTELHYGRQSETLGGISIFVMPSTSGRARRYFDLSHWRALAGFVGSKRAADATSAHIADAALSAEPCGALIPGMGGPTIILN
jgi:TDG/mug DNA glycosylase family protein